MSILADLIRPSTLQRSAKDPAPVATVAAVAVMDSAVQQPVTQPAQPERPSVATVAPVAVAEPETRKPELVTCGSCRSFEPDHINPPGGLGDCGIDPERWRTKPLLYPFAERRCADWQERFEERAAIMEFDGGMTREEAEKAAREIEGMQSSSIYQLGTDEVRQ